MRQPVAQAIAANLAQQVTTFTGLETASGVDLATHAGKLAPDGHVECWPGPILPGAGGMPRG